MTAEAESEFIGKEPCPECGSRDNLARYSDGHGYCFGCSHYEPADGDTPSTPRERKPMSADLLPIGKLQALPARKLTEETCKKWGYTVGEMSGKAVQIANYRDPETGQIVAQKVRDRNKDFRFLGDAKAGGLYGMHLWREAGKRIIITEGEIDAMSVSQVQGHKWPVVSVPTGADGAAKAIAKHLEWLLRFDEVVLMFDQDEAHYHPKTGEPFYPGQDAAKACALLFPPGRCKVAKIEGFKDANDALMGGKPDKIIDAIFAARTYRPDGIVTLNEVKAAALQPKVMGLPWFSEKLNYALYGRRVHEAIAIGAGTGVGKTELISKQIYHDLTVLKQPVGVFLLEQQPTETAVRLASTHAGKQFHVPNRDPNDLKWTTEELSDALDFVSDFPLFMYDSFGATDWDIIKSTIRFLHHSEGVTLFYLDHLTALAAAEEDERKGLERIMAEIGALVQELPIILHFVSHLATPEGKPHEEGGRVMIRHFKGSRAIGFWAHTMVGLERDQQHDDIELRRVTTIRVLKHRPVGSAVGETIFLSYDPDSGRYVELDSDPFKEPPDGKKHGFTDQSSGDWGDDIPF